MSELDEFAEALMGQLSVEIDEEKVIAELAKAWKLLECVTLKTHSSKTHLLFDIWATNTPITIMKTPITKKWKPVNPRISLASSETGLETSKLTKPNNVITPPKRKSTIEPARWIVATNYTTFLVTH